MQRIIMVVALTLILVGGSCSSSDVSSPPNIRVDRTALSLLFGLDYSELDSSDLDSSTRIRATGPCGSNLPLGDLTSTSGTQSVSLDRGRSLVIVNAKGADTSGYLENISSDAIVGCSYEDQGVMGPASVSVEPLALKGMVNADAIVGWRSTIEQSGTTTYQISLVVSDGYSILFIDVASVEPLDDDLLTAVLSAIEPD